MASKRGTTKGAGAASADQEIDDLFSGIGDKNTQSPAAGKTPVSAKPKPGDDILADLESELVEKPKAPSRPHTPRVAAHATRPPAARASLDEPKTSTSATAGNLPRKSAESARSVHAASFTPSATSSELQESERTRGTVEQAQQQAAAAGGGWWGGILSTATAAMKQAEAAVKEIQQNEDAKKYLESVRGNVGALRGLGKSAKTRHLFVHTHTGEHFFQSRYEDVPVGSKWTRGLSSIAFPKNQQFQSDMREADGHCQCVSSVLLLQWRWAWTGFFAADGERPRTRGASLCWPVASTNRIGEACYDSKQHRPQATC